MMNMIPGEFSIYYTVENFDTPDQKTDEIRESNLKNVVIRINFTNKVSVKHTIPVYALSLTSKLANITIGTMSTDTFICRFENELNNVASAYSNLYERMGLEVSDIQYIVEE